MTARIALIHAVTVAIGPIDAAFKRHWPQAERMNVLDDTLSVDRARDKRLTTAMTARIGALADYAFDQGADAVQYTCSAFGPAIARAAARHARPVLKPNAAMFEAALALGNRIGMVATFEPSVASMEVEFTEAAEELGRHNASIETRCVSEAMTALRAGDEERHNMLVATAAGQLRHCDAIMLAQVSTSIATQACSAEVATPILTSPDAAVLKLRSMLRGQ